MIVKRIWIRHLLALIILFYLLQGCVINYHDCVIHNPPLASLVQRIEKGKTTGNEIRIWFGVPDLQADGSEITLFPESTMGQYRLKLKDMLIKARKNVEQYEDKGVKVTDIRFSNIDPDYPEKIAMYQPYSSIDNEHIALLYLEHDIQNKGFVFVFPGGMTGKSSGLVRQNKLLLLINKNTNKVVEFSYWETFKTD